MLSKKRKKKISKINVRTMIILSIIRERDVWKKKITGIYATDVLEKIVVNEEL